MSDILIRGRGDAHWVYDDPSGVPDAPLTVPDTVRGRIEEAAALEGLSPAAWLVRIVNRALAPASPKAV